jgi:hypothetical protein
MLHHCSRLDGIGEGKFEKAMLDRGHTEQYDNSILLVSSILVLLS